MMKQEMHSKDLSPDKSWTLFLDRDGVINERLVGDYVKKPDEFRFIEGVPGAIAGLSNIFGRIVIVTNQQGIGKGLMRLSDLEIVHVKMLEGIHAAGGRIDKIYYCPHLESDQCDCRKPNTGMALQAQKDFPEIDFNKSIMVGDGLHDMKFGKALQMYTIFIGQNAINNPLIDLQFSSLIAFAEMLDARF